MTQGSRLHLVRNQPSFPQMDQRGQNMKIVQIEVPFLWNNGIDLGPIQLRGCLAGNEGGRVFGVLGGISAHCQVHSGQEQLGWWPQMVGPGKAIDLDKDQVLSMDYIGGAHGSIQAGELNQKQAGVHLEISTYDQANGLKNC